MTTAIAEIIESESHEAPTRPTALARVAPLAGGARVLALESMSEEDFVARLDLLRKGQERMRRIQRDLLRPDEDFGEIPGTGKPTLLKPGAEKLLKFYGLVPTFEITRVVGDAVLSPAVYVSVRCRIHVGDADGPVIAEGDGTCSTWERKYRYRKAQRACPSCGASIKRSKFPPKGSPSGEPGGWWCPRDTGCGTDFHHDDPEIAGQVVGDVENPDQHDLDNTIVKMAVKRALVAATLLATATSGLFTQDMEDMGPEPQVVRAAAQAAADETEAVIRPLCDSVREIMDLTEFDAAVSRMVAKALELPEPTRAVLRRRLANMRDALVMMVKQDSAAREAMRREPDPEPPIVESAADAAKRQELATALREPGDEPPPDVELPVLAGSADERDALALFEPCGMARTTMTLQKLWDRVKATPSYAAASKEAKEMAETLVKEKRAALLDEQRSKGGAQ